MTDTLPDIAWRLRDLEHMDVNKWSSAPVRNTVIDARKEIERLRAALERIADQSAFDSSLELKKLAQDAIAQQLEEKQK